MSRRGRDGDGDGDGGGHRQESLRPPAGAVRLLGGAQGRQQTQYGSTVRTVAEMKLCGVF